MTARSDPDPRRYAVYFAPPPGSALDRFGAAWLGRDAWTGAGVAQPALAGFDAGRLVELTAFPRHYGFHATLKPPFVLRSDTTPDELAAALDSFAGRVAPFRIGPLRPARLGTFLALVPPADPAVSALADACVEAFHPFAKPLAAAELERRAKGLTPRQCALLERWGYPYVFDEFRFHMTLTGPVDPAEGERLCQAMRPLLADATAEPVAVDAVSLFVEDSPGADFRAAQRFAFTGAASLSH